jgi:hypothetical protein
MIILLVAAAVLTGAPLVAVVLVTIASLREDAGQTLSGRAPNWIDAAARRLLSFDSSGPRRRSQHSRARRRRHADNEEVTRTLAGPRA